MTVIPLPSSYQMGKVVCRIVHAAADTPSDVDALPEARPASGKVIFTPKEKERKVTDVDYPAFVMHEITEVSLSNAGRIVDSEGRNGIYLIQGVWVVSFKLDGGTIDPFNIQVLPEHDEQNPLDLVTAVEYTPPAGAIVQTMLVPANGSPGNTLVLGNDSKTLQWAESPLTTVLVETGNEARPTAQTVFWIGGATEPINIQVGDIWFQEEGVAPTGTAPTITTTSLNALEVGTAFSQTLAKTGTTPITWAVTSGTPPAGLALSSAGVLSGTPSASGAYNFTVTATNDYGSDTQIYTGTVAAEVQSDTHTVFGTPPAQTYTTHNDGGGSINLASYFYGTQPLRIVGVRLWLSTIPASSGDLTLWSTVGFVDGSNVPQPPGWGDISALADLGRLVVIPQANLVQGWNEVTLPTPFQVSAITNPPVDNSFVMAGYKFGAGNHYSHAPNPGEPALQSSTASWFYLAEASFFGVFRSVANPGGWNQSLYGIDIRVEAV